MLRPWCWWWAPSSHRCHHLQFPACLRNGSWFSLFSPLPFHHPTSSPASGKERSHGMVETSEERIVPPSKGHLVTPVGGKREFLLTTSVLEPPLGAWEGKRVAWNGERLETGSGTPLQTKINLLQGSPGCRQDTGTSRRCCPNPVNPSGLKQQLPRPVISPEHPAGIISALKKKKK